MTSEEFADAQAGPVTLPPNDIEAELGILGCVMLDPYECIYECIAKFADGNEVFYDLTNRAIYAAMVALADELEPIDPITLNRRLKGEINPEGGLLPFLAGLAEKVPSASNLGTYLEMVGSKYTLRKMIKLCQGIISEAMTFNGDVGAFVDKAQGTFLTATQKQSKRIAVQCLPAVQRVMARIESYRENRGMITGVASGFTDFDRLTSGMRGGELIVIAARPGVGKSAIAMNIVEYVTCEQKMPVGIFSLEMSEDSLIERVVCSRARVSMTNVRDGFLADRDIPRLTWSAGGIGAAPIYVDDTAGLSILELRARARRMWQMYGIKLFVIDYLQLANSTAKKAQTRQQEVGDISRGCKQLSKELDVPVIALAQLNRALEKDGKRLPRLSDLREAGDLEQDADLVAFLYRPDTDDENDNPYELDVISVNLLIAKQRRGPTGIVPLTFTKSQTRFSSQTRQVDTSADEPANQAEMTMQ